MDTSSLPTEAPMRPPSQQQGDLKKIRKGTKSCLECKQDDGDSLFRLHLTVFGRSRAQDTLCLELAQR